MKAHESILSVIALCFIAPHALRAQDSASEKAETGKLRVVVPAEQQSSTAGFVVELKPANAKLGDTVTLSIQAEIAKPWHINPINMPEGAIGLATKFDLEAKNLVPLEAEFRPSQPAAIAKTATGEQLFHSGKVTWTRKFRVKGSEVTPVTGSILFQACDDERCLPPRKLEFSLVSSPTKKGSITSVNPSFPAIGRAQEIHLHECDLKRPKVKISLLGALFGSTTDKLGLRGTFDVAGKKYDIFLPKMRRYSLKNTSSDETRIWNTATYASIDYNGDGVLTSDEAQALNRPIRVGDSMYQVTSIDQENASLTIQQVSAPLSGCVVGERVVPFELKTLDGKTITDKSIEGKVTLLDIWAVT